MPINFHYVKLKSGFEIARGESTGDTSPVSKSLTLEDKVLEPKKHSFQKGKSDQTFTFDWFHNKHQNINGVFIYIFNC